MKSHKYRTWSMTHGATAAMVAVFTICSSATRGNEELVLNSVGTYVEFINTAFTLTATGSGGSKPYTFKHPVLPLTVPMQFLEWTADPQNGNQATYVFNVAETVARTMTCTLTDSANSTPATKTFGYLVINPLLVSPTASECISFTQSGPAVDILSESSLAFSGVPALGITANALLSLSADSDLGDSVTVSVKEQSIASQLKLSSWPDENTAWGQRDLTVILKRISDQSEMLNTTESVSYFYDPLVKHFLNAFGVAIPHWFKYWLSGNVVAGLDGFSYAGTDGEKRGAYIAGSKYIYEKAFEGKPETTVYNLCYNMTLDTGANGICEIDPFDEAWYDDDVVLVAKGGGKADTTCISSQYNAELISVVDESGTDDYVVEGGGFHFVKTGPNGICDTICLQGDTPHIEYGQGEPYQPSISYAADHYLRCGVDAYVKYNVLSDDVLSMNVALETTFNETIAGVAAVASTVAHENMHETLDVAGWDYDNDSLNDSNEDGSISRLCPGVKDTYGLQSWFSPDYANYGDNEYLARRAASTSPATLDTTKDWSKNGSMWLTQ